MEEQTMSILTMSIPTPITVTPSANGDDIDTQFISLQQNLTKIQQQLRVLEKTIKKETKETKETKKYPPKPAAMKQPKIIGFDIQEKITSELAAFMRLPPESSTTTTRNTATTFITEYIRNHKLQDMTDRKQIHLNEELAALFKLTTADAMTYFNLHKFISKLFIRA